MDEITVKTMTLFKAAIAAKMPVMMVGAPGTGKTATVKQLAKDMDYRLITLVGSRMDPTDVTGLPKGVPMGEDENGQEIHATAYLSPYWQVEILRHKKVILFLDEYSNSPGAIQAAFLTILQDREFSNGHKFPDETIIIGASNPVDEAADGYEMALPTTNRIFWVSWQPSHESWYEGMLNGWGQEVSEEESRWKGRIVSFIRDNPSWLHKQPDEKASPESYGLTKTNASDLEVLRSAWASRRSWDNVSRVLAAAPNDIYIQDTILQGIVGYPAALAFRDWLRKHNTIKPEAVLKDPTKLDWKNLSVDDANLLFRSLLEKVNENNAMDVLRVFHVCADNNRQGLAGAFVRDAIQKTMQVAGNKNKNKAEALKMRDYVAEMIKKYQNISAHAQ